MNIMLLQLGTGLKITLRLWLGLVASGSCRLPGRNCLHPRTVGDVPTGAEILLIALCCGRLVRRWIFCGKRQPRGQAAGVCCCEAG